MGKVKAEDSAPCAQVLATADRLHSAAIHLLRRVRKQDVVSGVGPAQLSALSVLVFAGPKMLGELAVAEQVRPPTMSRIVAGLKRSKLIEIRRDANDARRMQIRATLRGKRLLQKGRQRRIEYLAEHLKELSRPELEQLANAAVTIEKLFLHTRVATT